MDKVDSLVIQETVHLDSQDSLLHLDSQDTQGLTQEHQVSQDTQLLHLLVSLVILVQSALLD